MQDDYQLEMDHITKRFGGVKALTEVTLKIKKGEVHALVGENGAGKSTLMKILSGVHQKDSGEIRIDGSEVQISTPRDAIDLGISVIYQEFMLAPDLSVAENIYIDRLVNGKMFINWKELSRKTKEQLERLGFGDIDPSAKVGDLSVAYQQVVEICKSLTRNSKIIIFDEPTAVLTFSEIEKLFKVIRKLKDDGVSVVYISHRLEEVFELCDTITVLKDGCNVKTLPASSIDKLGLVSLMIGREITQLFPPRNARIGEEILSVQNLSSGRMVKNVSFSVHAGEVVGFSGLVGSGRTETMRAIFGIDRKDSGKIVYFNKEINFKDPKEAIKAGFGLLSEDRKGQGLILEQSIRVNSTLSSLHKVKNRLGVINHSYEEKYVTDLLAKTATKYGSIEDNVSSLSGGNQQKVSLAKWLSADCRCIVFDEPTRGVDVGAKREIYEIMNHLAEQGIGIIMISSEMTEIIGMCDRAVIMRQGAVVGELGKSELNEDNLVQYAMGVKSHD